MWATTLLLRLDLTFLATASYPITVDPTVNWSTYHAYTTLTYDRLAPLSELTYVEGDPTDPNRGISDYTYDLVRNRLRHRRVRGSHHRADALHQPTHL